MLRPIITTTLTLLLTAAVSLPAGAYPADRLERDPRPEALQQRLDCLLAELIEESEARQARQQREHNTLRMAVQHHLDPPAQGAGRMWCEVRR